MDSVDPNLIPALTPPEGVTPNFVDPETYVYLPLVFSFVCLALATIMLAARLFTRLVIMKKMAWEDCTLYLVSSVPITDKQDTLLFGWVCLLRIRSLKFGILRME